MANSESESAADLVRSDLVTCLAQSIAAAATQSRSPREFLDQVAPLVRDHFGAWLAVATMPHRSDLLAVDSDDNGGMIDPELLRFQMRRAGVSSNSTTIRLADGRGSRSLQVTVGHGDASIGLGIVHRPEQSLDSLNQVQQLRTLALATDAAYRAIHSLTVSNELAPTPFIQANELSRARLLEFHRELDVDATAMAIAAESGWLVDCDRVCVLLRRGNHYRLAAVTGVDVIDRRGNEPSYLEQLATTAAAIDKPLVYPAHVELPPQIELPLNQYLDQSLVQSGVLVPIRLLPELNDGTKRDQPGRVIGAIAFERYRGEPIGEVSTAMKTVCDEASLALQNSLTHQSVFMLPVWQTVGHWVAPARRHRTLAVLATMLALFVASLLIQIDYKVIATGTIEPQSVRNLFASSDAVVRTLHVNDGDMVSQGALLVELENAELERQAEEISGEVHTVIEQIAAIDAVLVSSQRQRQQVSEGDEMAIERRHLQAQLESLRAQQSVIAAEQKRQSIYSPIDGQVVGWRLRERIEHRPVSRGHRLFAIVDSSGPHVLRLEISDHDMGDVLTLSREQSEPLRLEFVLATRPDCTYQATSRALATSTRVDDQGVSVLDLTAAVVPGQAIEINMGAEVTAKIACGRRSVLATWFGDIANFYHRYVRFYLS